MKNTPPVRTRLPWFAALATTWIFSAPLPAQTSVPLTAPPPPADETVVLGVFEVRSAKDFGYLATNSISGSRVAIPIRDTPMSLQIVNRELIDDLAAFDLRDVLRFNAGVNILTSLNGSEFNLRGFRATRYVNGFPAGQGISDSAGAERVEVLKGATTILYGVSSPGGIINTIAKKPLFTNAVGLKATAGSGDFRRFDLDVNLKPAADKLGLRLVAARAENEGYGWIDFWEGTKTYLFPSATLRLTPKTTLNVSHEHLSNDSSPLGQVIRYGATLNGAAIAGNPPAIGYGVTQNFKGPHSRQEQDSDNTRVELLQDVAPRWLVRGAVDVYTYGRTRIDLIGNGRIADNGYTQNVLGRYDRYNEYGRYGQIELVGKFDAGEVKNNLLAGFAKTDEEIRHALRQTAANVASLDLRRVSDPSIYPSLSGNETDYATISATDNTKVKNDYNAFYASTQSYFLQERGLLLLGVRRDDIDVKSLNRVTQVTTKVANTKVSPQAGASFRIVPDLSLFALYSTSLTPNTQTGANGEAFAPQEAKNLEGGVKLDFFGGALSASAAVFQIERKNIPRLSAFVPGVPQYNVLSGKEESKGGEIDVVATPRRNWQILAGYTYLDARTTADTQTPARVGLVVNYAPRHSARLWTRYTFSDGAAKGWWLGGGVTYQSEVYAGNLSNIPFAAYQRYDLAAGYDFKLGGHRCGLQANLHNVFDKAYVEDPDAYGAPRTFSVSLKAEF